MVSKSVEALSLGAGFCVGALALALALALGAGFCVGVVAGPFFFFFETLFLVGLTPLERDPLGRESHKCPSQFETSQFLLNSKRPSPFQRPKVSSLPPIIVIERPYPRLRHHRLQCCQAPQDVEGVRGFRRLQIFYPCL